MISIRSVLLIGKITLLVSFIAALDASNEPVEIPEDTIQNMGIHGSITGKTMMRIIYFDHITTATAPLPNL